MNRILVMGATGMLGIPVTNEFLDRGYRVRVLVRHGRNAGKMFGGRVEAVEGSSLDIATVREAMEGCDAVHINLTQEAELTATRLVTQLAEACGVGRVSYVSATSVCEENRWFELVDIKFRAEEILRQSAQNWTIFRPTWVMESLHNFAKGTRITAIVGRNPPPLHFFAGADFGRIVADSFETPLAVGKTLYVHGPEGVTLPAAIARYASLRYPDRRITTLSLWKARAIAAVSRRKGLKYVTRLIAFFDRIGEIGDPSETNALFGAPSTTLDEWLALTALAQPGHPPVEPAR